MFFMIAKQALQIFQSVMMPHGAKKDRKNPKEGFANRKVGLTIIPPSSPRAAFFRRRHAPAGGRYQRPANGARIPEIARILRTQRAQLIAAARAQTQPARAEFNVPFGAESTP